MLKNQTSSEIEDRISYVATQIALNSKMSRVMKNPTICIWENKDADQLRGNCEADQRLCFSYTDITILYFLYPKFPAASHPLCLYSLVCVRPVGKPRWFSHDVAQMKIEGRDL